MSADRRAARRVGAIAALALLATGCSWFTDFKDQPKVEPWEAEMAGNDTTPFRGSPEFSVPVTGVVEPAYVVSHAQLPATIDSMSGLRNEHAPTRASLDNGRKYYQINCAVCHGAAGAGNGPAVQYGVPAPSLLTDITKNRTDGYIFGMIRNGRGLMPTYDRIEDMDRWDVVNYVRALQGKIPGVVADTSPAGYPGQNGRLVPGPTLTAPTRPAPYRAQDLAARLGAGESASGADTTHTAAPAPRAAAAPQGARP
ncbi:MAG TPA: cytochrome c [Gemmatimonadaceae bacterium]